MLFGVPKDVGAVRNMDKAALWALLRSQGGKMRIKHADLPLTVAEDSYWINCTIDPRDDFITLEAKSYQEPPSWAVNRGKPKSYKMSADVVAVDPREIEAEKSG